MSRFLVSRPGYMAIATRRTKSGRTMFAAVTRTARPGPVGPPDPFAPPAQRNIAAGVADDSDGDARDRASMSESERAERARNDTAAADALAKVPAPLEKIQRCDAKYQ